MTLIIAGVSSGVGKTTCTLCMLAYLQRYGVQSFKVGPDYIDPMFHEYITGRPCRNLDPVLTDPEYVQQCFALHTRSCEFALVEGVMGLFDGITITTANQEKIADFASTAHIARILDLPVLLVIDCSRLSGSVGAIVLGYRTFDPRIALAGVVLNRVGSDRHLELLLTALEPLQVPILGVLRREDNITIPDRHLGLVPTAELPHLDAILDKLAHLGENSFDWERLMPLVQCSPKSPVTNRSIAHQCKTRLAIARDAAFSFYYQDNLDLLQQLGAELIPWSPLADKSLPEGVQGLYFGGGFPEMFAQQLAENLPVRQALRQAILTGMPTYAECGGLMYLCEFLVDFASKSWPMVGVLPASTIASPRLTLGYRQAVALRDSPLLRTDVVVRGHEFHRSQLTAAPKEPLYWTKGYHSGDRSGTEGWQLYRVHASYIHLHWGGIPSIPAQFLQSMSDSGKLSEN